MSKLSFLTILTLLCLSLPAHAIETKAQQAFVIDFETEQVLLSKNADQKTPTSSMSKVMTSYMVFDALKNGWLSMDDTFYVSEKAWKKGGSKMFVPQGEKVTIEDLLRGVIVQSGNDATIVLAEGLSGTEEAFARQTTAKAKELGMTNTNFVNASGWPDEGHYSTAKDLSIMARAMINNFPDYYKMFSETEFTFGGIKQQNRNPLLYQNIGADGMKTGHTEAAGYGLIGSAKQDDRRVIMVLNGMDSNEERTEESTKIMTWALKNFKNISFFKEDKSVATINVVMGEEDNIAVGVKDPITITVPTAQSQAYKMEAIVKSPLIAPVKQGTEIGTLHVTINDENNTKKEYPLYATNDVAEAGFFDQFKTKARKLIFNKI